MSARTPPPGTKQLTRRMAIVAALSVIVIGGAVIETPRLEAMSGAIASSVVTVEPTRVLDTRFGTGLPGDLTANELNNVHITGSIPTRKGDANVFAAVVPQGATGVLLNVTALRPQADGFFSVRPGTATGEPSASNLNFTAGSVVPNAVTVALTTTGAGAGSIDLWYGTGTSGATTGALIDVVGYTIEAGSGATPGPAGPAGADGDELYERTLVVKSGGDSPKANGGELLAAVDSTAGTAADPWVIELEPGEYDLSSQALTLGDFVSLRGAGSHLTKITSLNTSAVINAGTSSSITALEINGNAIAGGDSISHSLRIARHDDVHLADLIVTSTGRDILIESAKRTTVERVDVSAMGFAIDVSDKVSDFSVRDSTAMSSGNAAVNLGLESAATLIERSTLTAIDVGASAIHSDGGDGEVRYSTLLSEDGGAVSNLEAETSIRIFQSHFVVAETFGTNFTNGSAQCSAISEIGAFSPTACP